ncbi:MAG: Type 1 glutamine amidotransferase-like domain-containing protein [Solobacterium sp.]|nr:Type 1 glutamine amidotransferase-like domain-containing protein [Solobacterium sp.]
MINVLLNISNFDEPWAYGSLEPLLPPHSKVLILPLSYDEGWITDAYEYREKYGRGTEGYEELVRPFRAFGIDDDDISWINYYEDDRDSALRKLENAEVLFFTGGYPDWMLQRLYDLGIKEDIAAFDGVVMGTSAGALVQLDEYHLNEEEGYPYQIQEGLGLIGGFDIDVHYEESETHMAGIIRSIEDMDRPVVCMPNDGGMILDGENVELLGGAFVLTRDNLDELYEAYEALQYGW